MNDAEKKKVVYVEPVDYFPEEVRKKYKLGEFAENNGIENSINNVTENSTENKAGDEEK